MSEKLNINDLKGIHEDTRDFLFSGKDLLISKEDYGRFCLGDWIRDIDPDLVLLELQTIKNKFGTKAANDVIGPIFEKKLNALEDHLKVRRELQDKENLKKFLKGSKL